MFKEAIKDWLKQAQLVGEVGCYHDNDFNLWCQNQDKALNSLTKRKKENLLTDYVCEKALKAFGFAKEYQRIHGPENQPLWPEGLKGSITHKNDYSIVALSDRKEIRNIGIDLEFVNGGKIRNIENRILLEEENRLIEKLEENYYQQILLLFSAKESIFKAINPLVGEFFGFKTVKCIKKENELLEFLFTKPLGLLIDVNDIIKVKFKFIGEYIFTLAIY